MQETIRSEVDSAADKYGFDDIQTGVEKTLDILEDSSLDGSYWIKPYTDFDGPVKKRGTGDNQYHDGVKEAFDLLVDSQDILNPGIISGRGTGYLLGQIEELEISQVDLAGEMGAAYFLRDELEGELPDAYDASYVVPEEEESMAHIYSFNLTMFEHLAEHDLQLMYGDNMSNVTGSACVEAFGANLDESRFSVEDTVYADLYRHANSQNVQEQVKQYAEQQLERDCDELFDFHNDLIRFERSEEAAEALTEVFIANPFIPWGFHDEGDRITIFPEYRAREEFDSETFEYFVESVAQDYNQDAEREFWVSTYEDHSFDFGKKGYENMKTQAAETMITGKNMGQPILPTNTGDKPTDILQLEDSVFFAQEDTEAHRHCQENDIPHVEVENVVESFLIQAEVASINSPAEGPQQFK